MDIEQVHKEANLLNAFEEYLLTPKIGPGGKKNN